MLDVREYKYLYTATSNSFKKLLWFTVFYESLKSWLANSVSSHCTVISCSLLTFVLQFQDRNLNLKQSNAIRCHRISQSVNNICLCSSTTERCLSQLDDFTTKTLTSSPAWRGGPCRVFVMSGKTSLAFWTRDLFRTANRGVSRVGRGASLLMGS